ncbi:FAD-dependent oxidoreductase [Dongia soli]|uniref:FAD-dependent oxidoreductase n=1 Tax=Dongia soli TaxID=600628 RepID=A0ABU5EFS4_9PROT|nr:FAD-dependent oxidoreductase [Dongia soli]MDY0885182.1 FAD-dependent oxidoreductase [Dongia soli]
MTDHARTDYARVVIIGGGAVGCSALYHLAQLGWTDCLLLERDELTSGSTWHAAGNCPNFSTNWNIIKFQRHSTELYARLGEEVDYPINYHITGSIRLAHSQERMDEYWHVVAMARAQGIDFELLDPAEIKAKYPFMELHDIVGGLWDPHDGDIDPSQLTQAYAKGAKDKGARVQRFTKVTGLERTPKGEWKVITDKGDILCEIVVNAAGYRAGEIMAMVGQYMPIVSMSHQYLVTETIPELESYQGKLPLMRDPDVSYYLRQERHGLILGPYEKERAQAHWLDGIPEDFAYQLYPDDLERLETYIEAAIGRVPILGKVGVQRVINGPIPYSPDGNPYIGPAHGLPNFYQCCCFSFGIAQSGGAGKTVAEWIAHGEPEWDFWSLDPRRYTDYATKSYVVDKALELYQNEYAIAYPSNEWPAGRPAKVTPLYEKLKAKGANFCARGGWERAAWFPQPGADPTPRPSFRRSNWHDSVAAECKAVRERVGILDLGGFSKLMLDGPGAAAWLDGMICGKLPKTGRITLSYMLNDKGGIVSEFTITRLAENRFYLISAAAAEWHDIDWIEKHLPADGSVTLSNVSARMGSIIIAGPKARELLSQVTETDLSNKAFPWLSGREIEIGFARMLALRVNYVGELGWELHCPVEHMVSVYDRLWAAGEAHGIADFGMYAMDSLRLEKCYRGWKSDMTHEYTPLMASLDRFVDFQKPDYKGLKALTAERQNGSKERFVPLLLDDEKDCDAPACAPVYLGDYYVGLVSSGGYGHTLGKSIALAYVRSDLAKPGTELEVLVLGERRKAVVAEEPLYDPENARLRM